MTDLPPLLQAALQLRAETSISRLFLPAMDDNNCPPLSPAAQVVIDAAYAGNAEGDVIGAAAAALRAAADQVAPSDLDEPRNYLPMAMECQRIRKELLAIAAELEGAQ